MVEKFLNELLGMDGGGPVLTLFFVFLLSYFLYHQIIKPASKTESTDARLTKIELGIHDLRNIMQHEGLRKDMITKDIDNIRMDVRNHEQRLTVIETKQTIQGGHVV